MPIAYRLPPFSIFGMAIRTAPDRCGQGKIQSTITDFEQAARRVVAAKCDGLEITASKGYLIHQFLNPVTNRRTDEYGGSVDKRFQLLAEIVSRVRKAIGPDFLFGVRLAAKDFSFSWLNTRFPWPAVARRGMSGTATVCRDHALRTAAGSSGGRLSSYRQRALDFPIRHGSPGDFPDQAVGVTFNAYRFLSAKAWARATLFNLFPADKKSHVRPGVAL